MCVCMEGDPATLPLKLFWGLVSPGQGHALGSFPLSMSGQDWLAAECSVVEDLQEFGICFRANEKNQTDGQVRGREVLSLLFTDGVPVWGFGFHCFQKTFNEGIL